MGEVSPKSHIQVVIMEATSWLRDYITAIKNGRLHPFSVVERKARAATRNEAWGPSGTMLAELADLSNDQEHCEVIFAVLEYRIRSREVKWLCVYKALQVLEYLLQRGSSHCCNAAQELVVPLAALQNFTYVGPDKRDHGLDVRLRAEAVKALILDTEGLAKKRAQLAARSGNMKFAGYSREEAVAAAAAAAKGPVGGLKGSSTESPSSGGSMTTAAPAMIGSREGGGGMATPVKSLAVPGSPLGGGATTSPSTYRPASLVFASSASRLAQQSNFALRNAGETKGVTFEQNKRQLDQLRQLTLLKDNSTCADCASAAAAARPTWASINLGVFICMRCAGIHRGLGVHISKVRSTTLDTWLPEQVATMARLGNRKANEYFEAGLDPAMRPGRDNTQDLEHFIRLKYADKAWAAKGLWPPEDASFVSSEAAQPQYSGEAPPALGTAIKQSNGALSPSPRPPLPCSRLPGPGTALWPPSSSCAPFGGSTTGGCFGDAPPAWPSTVSSMTPPIKADPNRAMQQQLQQQVQQGSIFRPGQIVRMPGQEAPGCNFKDGGADVLTTVRLLPPPPSAVPRSAMAGVVPSSGECGGGDCTLTDLLRLDSDSEEDDDDDDDGDGMEESGGSRGGGSTGARGVAATGGAADTGSTALWDLLDLNVDVMTFLERTEGAAQQQKQQQQSSPPPLPPPPPPATTEQQQQTHQRVPSAPVIGTAPAVAGGVPVATAYLTIPAGCLSFVTPITGQALGGSSGIAAGAVGAVATAANASRPPRLGVAESIIMTSEFPVYDLLTPLPTGGGVLSAVAAPLAVATAGTALGAGHSAVAAPRPMTTPPASFSHPFPPSHLQYPAPHSAPLPQTHPHSTSQTPTAASAAVPAAVATAAAAITIPATTASTPCTAGGRGQNDNDWGRVTGIVPRAFGGSGGTVGTGMGLRGTPAQAVNATAASGPSMDLDNLLAMQLDTLDTSLANGPSGNGNGGLGGGGIRPSWQAAGAVGSVYGSLGGGRR